MSNCVLSRNLNNEAAYAQVGLLQYRKEKTGAHLKNVHVLGPAVLNIGLQLMKSAINQM